MEPLRTHKLPRSQSETGRSKLQQRHTRSSTASSSIVEYSNSINRKKLDYTIYSPPSSSNPSSSTAFPPNSSTPQVVKQLVIRARPHLTQPLHNQQPISDGLHVLMCIRVAIPYSSIPLPGSPDLILPLMSDQRLRLTNHAVFPITRRASNSKPTIWASNHLSQATLAASLLDLSKSFKTKNKHHIHQRPSISVVVRNFNISLLIPPSSPPPISLDYSVSPPPAMAEYAIILDCISLWATVGPEWPFSAILPTPPCLKNSFRLILPANSTDTLFEKDPKIPLSSPAVHLNTFPPLRRERMRFSTSSKNIFSATKLSSIPHDDDLRPLSDESEPEGITLSDEEESKSYETCRHWPQDELSPRFEGVFQSTKDLCILLGSHPAAATSQTPLNAKHASSQLSISLSPTPTSQLSNPDPAAMDINFHLDLQHVSTRCINDRTPFILALPQLIAKSIISAQWSPLNGEGVLETQLPSLAKSEKEKSPNSSPATSNPHYQVRSHSNQRQPSPSDRSSTGASVPEFDLLNTAAPFLDSKFDMDAETMRDDSDCDLDFDHCSSADELSCSPSKINGTTLQNSQSTISHQFVIWVNTEWLIRRAATNLNSAKSRLILNLRGQLEIAATSSPSTTGEAGSKQFPVPFFTFPSVEEHVCTCEISRQDLRLTLPPWASLVEQSSDEQTHQLLLALPQPDFDPTEVIVAHFDQIDSRQPPVAVPITPESVADQAPSSPPLPRHTESLSINNLFINSASRIKCHSRRSTVSPLSFVKKRSRLNGSLRNKSNKVIALIDDGTQLNQFEERPQVKPTIRSVQVNLVIDYTSNKQPLVSQYAEVSITFCRSSEITDPHLNLIFPISSDSSADLEVIGVWINDWELARDRGFQVLDLLAEERDGPEEPTRFVTIKVDVTSVEISRKAEKGSLLPTLRMIVASKTTRARNGKGSFIALLPSVEKSSVATYKALLQASAGAKIEVQHSNMIVTEITPEKVKLIRYALPAGASLWTSASIESCLAILAVPEKVSSLPDPKPPKLKSDVDTLVEKNGNNRKSMRGLPMKTPWVEEWVVRWGLKWKTVFLCWLIYLVTSMSIQVDQMRGRLEQMDGIAPLYKRIELRQSVGQMAKIDQMVSNFDASVHPSEEEVAPRHRSESIDLQIKTALLKTFLASHDCARRDPLVKTEPPLPGIAEPAPPPSMHRTEQPPPLSQTTDERLQDTDALHGQPSAEMMRDLMGFIDRFFLVTISQPLAKLARSIGSFRRKLSFSRPHPIPAEL
ncbi:uncharacterized protein VP01_2431g1 [Puccinia sorghi]|uniref:Uncharacterized protein n=1 Tax=Puccinia sorghi TaxID=27349 RepID=A0A0L6V6H0_9BASI|nr:uncharacterized protein VP01_2431g1 [Puccinia sorghi]